MQPEDQCPPRHPLLRMTSEKLRPSFHNRILKLMCCLILEKNLADVTSQTQETKSRISKRRSMFFLQDLRSIRSGGRDNATFPLRLSDVETAGFQLAFPL